MVSNSLRAVNRLLAPLARRMRLMVGRSFVHLIDDARNLQELQVEILNDDVADGAERFQEYGFTSHPKRGAEAIVLCVGGSRAHPVIVAVDDRRFRLKSLAEGEVALYTDEGDYVWFKRGRNIEVVAGTKAKVTSPLVEVIASTKVTMTTPLVEMSQELRVTGKITGTGGLAISGGTGATFAGNVAVAGGNVTADGIGLKTHVHGGVQPGSGNTGGPSG